jgi:hypothetical protein
MYSCVFVMIHLGRATRIPRQFRFGREEFTFETKISCQMIVPDARKNRPNLE